MSQENYKCDMVCQESDFVCVLDNVRFQTLQKTTLRNLSMNFVVKLGSMNFAIVDVILQTQFCSMAREQDLKGF